MHVIEFHSTNASHANKTNKKNVSLKNGNKFDDSFTKSFSNVFGSISGNCSAGYYCPQGEITPDPHQCLIGHYCPEHTSQPVICPSGFYQDLIGQDSCKTCPDGYFCDNSYGVVVVNDTVKCPEGFFCPPGLCQCIL